MPWTRTAALAGASGFLGRHLLRTLRAHGWRVRALVRKPADAEALAREGFDTVLGDLGDREALGRLVDGAEVTVNCAGLIKALHRGAFDAVNRDGAARLAAAARGRIVLVSSLAAREPQLSDYAASKRAGEDASRAVAAGRLAIMRPPVIYGPGDKETLALFRLARLSAFAPVPARPEARLALAHVEDVASGIVDLMERPTLVGVYALGGERPAGYAWSEIAEAAWQAMGRKARLAPIPGWAVMMAAAASQVVGTAARLPPVFTIGKACEMLHADWSVRANELAPGGRPAQLSLTKGFESTVAWYRAAGWL